MEVALLCIGDELLKGSTVNTNLAFLGEKLLENGMIPKLSLEVPDRDADIRGALGYAFSRADVVLTSGGLGPTADDLTKSAVANWFGLPLVHRPEAERAVRMYWHKLHSGTAPAHWTRQADLPEGAEAIPNGYGSAPGIRLERNGKMIILMPGPPSELRPMFTDSVLPLLKAKQTERVYTDLLRIAGVGESEVEDLLEPHLVPEVSAAYCAQPGLVRLFLTSKDDALLKRVAAEARELFRADILPAGFTCPHCGKSNGFTKEEDTLDGWFDSGSSHFASMKKDQGFWPADVYMEGLDQYRGWFQAALLTAVGSTGVAKAPFKTCITHGWTVDGEGKAMHKSLGNGVDPYDIMNKYGADLIRLWAASADYHADMRCSEKIFKQLSQNYLKFRNTARYCLGNLNGFDPDNLVAPADMLALDKWAITRLNALIQKCFQGYDDYDFNVVTHAVNDFCVVEMSNFYLDIIKDRLYCEGKDSLARRSAQTALYLILDTMTKIMAPVLCFTGDEIWQSMPHAAGVDGRNVVFNDMNQPFADYALSTDEMAQWDKIIAVRDVVNGVLETARAEKKIGKSLEADIVLTVPAEDAFLAEMPAEALADLLIVSQVEVTVGDAIQASVKTAEGGKCQRCWKVLPTVNAEGLCPRCAKAIQSLV